MTEVPCVPGTQGTSVGWAAGTAYLGSLSDHPETSVRVAGAGIQRMTPPFRTRKLVLTTCAVAGLTTTQRLGYLLISR
jgi:hypothetical protein